MKNKLLLVSSIVTALSAMTAGAISNITPLTNGDYLFNSSEYSSIVGSNGNSNSPAGNLTLVDSIVDVDSIGATGIHDVPLGSYIGSYIPTSLYAGDRFAILKWGGGQAGVGSYWQVYDLFAAGPFTGIPTVPTLPDGTPLTGYGGLSSFRTVPDGGSTVMLLGAALSVIAVARRKFGV